MPEIKPDLSDSNRCVSVHWTLPVQCVLPSGHRENWHEAWHPQTSNRLRYQRSMGGYATEELNDGWRDLEIPPPGGFCNDQFTSSLGAPANVRCTGQYGHGWYHRAIVDGCTYSWNTPIPKGVTEDQLTQDVKQLRGMLVAAHSRIADLETERKRYVGAEPTIAEEMAYLSRCFHAVHDVCDEAEQQAKRWEHPLPIPEWVAAVRAAASGERDTTSAALPWAHVMPDDDLHGFLNDLVSAAIDRWRSDPEVPDRDILANIEKVCADWRTPGQGYRSDEDETGEGR